MSDLSVDETLLGLLAVEPQHGYQLLGHFRPQGALSRVWRLSTSQLYSVLKRLETTGCIRGECVPGEDAPARVRYALTPAGEARLQAWLAASPSPSIRCVRVEFLSRLFVLRMLGLPTTPAVRAQKRACASERERLQHERDSVPAGIDFLALSFQIAQLEAALDWIDRCELIPKGQES